MRRIKLLVAVVAAMTMLVVMAAPAMAGDWDDRHHDDFFDGRHHDDEDFDGRHSLFINDFEDFDDEDFDYEDYVELDECELVSLYDDEAVLVCELDF